MSFISSWLLKILGIVILGVLIDLVLPNGKMNNFIKSIFGIFTIFVIIFPFTTLMGKNYDFSSLLYNQTAIEVDKDFILVTNNQIKEQLQLQCENSLEKSGFLNVDVEIDNNLEVTNFQIIKVKINLKKLVLNANIPHINKYTEIKQVIINELNVKEEIIEINE